MQAKMVSIKELSDPLENPTLCLSALRVFDKCHECSVYRIHQATNQLDKLKCKPHVNPRYLELLKQKRVVLDQIATIEKEMSNL